MNADNALEQELQRFGAVVFSMRSIVDDVMVRVMAQPLTVRRRRRVHKLLAASVAGLAACLAVGITTWILTHRGKPAGRPLVASTSGVPRETLPDGAAKAELETSKLLVVSPERVRRTPNPGSRRLESASARPLPQWMAATKPSAIVRGKMLALKDGQLDIEVARVIYGRVDGKVVHVRARDTEEDARNWLCQLAQESKKEVREPSAEEVRAELVRRLNFAVGREVIVFLKEWPQGGGTTVWSYTRMAVDTSPSPKHFLDNEEKEIMEVIKTRAHLRPVDTTPDSSGRQLAMSEKVKVESERVNLMPVQEASAIVRVKMLTLKDGQLDIEVTRVIYGRVDGKILHVRTKDTEEDVRNAFRQRARESKKEVREPSAEEVRAELVRQINFAVGREAIVFLTGEPQGTNPAVWAYAGMEFDVPPEHPLDNVEKELVTIINNRARPSRIGTTPLLGFDQCLINIMPVQESSAIVRVKELALKGDVLEYEVIRVIYGRVDGKILHVRAGKDDQYVRNALRHRAREAKKEVREPSAEEVRAEMVRENYFKAGRESIIFLRGGPQGTNPPVWPACGGVYDTPFYPFDKYERDVVDVIKTGAHLRPVGIPGRPGACELLPCIRYSERVVRARLVKVGETSAQWQVSGLLYVAPPPEPCPYSAPEVLYRAPPPGQRPGAAPAEKHPAEAVQPEKPATISVDLATWRARAETIVRYRVAQQPGTAVKEEDIQVEYTRLLKDELTPGREAILFIRPREKPGDGAVYLLVGIAYGDPDKANSLDQHEKTIREAIAKLAKGDDNNGLDDL